MEKLELDRTLFHLVRCGKVERPPFFEKSEFDMLLRTVRQHDVYYFDAQNCFDDVIQGRFASLQSLPARLPFDRMWIEGGRLYPESSEVVRHAALSFQFHTEKCQAAHLLNVFGRTISPAENPIWICLYFFVGLDGFEPCSSAGVGVHLLLNSAFEITECLGETDGEIGTTSIDSLANVEGVPSILHAIWRLNAINSRLERVPTSGISHLHSGSLTPSSVWRLVTIDNNTADVSDKSGNSKSRELRLHWVRGHWRRIDGGNRAVWISAHKRGNAELGEVVHEYSIGGHR